MHRTKPKSRRVDAAAVLLVEDDEEMRRLLAWHLRHKGYVTVECSNGRQAMAKLEVSDIALGPPYDVVISDVRMPEADGFEILSVVRRLSSPPPVILMTAFPHPDTFRRARQLGASAIFGKPFDLNRLLTTVGNLKTLPWKRPEPTPPPLPISYELDITLRGIPEPETGPVQTFVREAASKLNVFGRMIRRARIVVGTVGKQQGTNGAYTARLELRIVGSRTLTLEVPRYPDGADPGLYGAIRHVFRLGGRQLAMVKAEQRERHVGNLDVPRPMRLLENEGEKE